MRHAIIDVGSCEHLGEAPPRVRLRDNQKLREVTWYACLNQGQPMRLLDDSGNRLLALLWVPVLAYKLHQLVHSTKLWSGARPLILVRGRGLSSCIAAYAGTWGGGDVVESDLAEAAPLRPTRFLLPADGSLKLNED